MSTTGDVSLEEFQKRFVCTFLSVCGAGTCVVKAGQYSPSVNVDSIFIFAASYRRGRRVHCGRSPY